MSYFDSEEENRKKFHAYLNDVVGELPFNVYFPLLFEIGDPDGYGAAFRDFLDMENNNENKE
jgi:hypothetical protein